MIATAPSSCANGSKLRARYVVSAVPFSVLREIDITPMLRGDRAMP